MEIQFDPSAHPLITVDPVTDCWHGQGHEVKGHIRLALGGRRAFGHVVMYAAFIGPVPRGSVLHHTCEVPDCWNPWHLEPVSATSHAARHTAQRTGCPAGHPYPENAITDKGRLRCRICVREWKLESKRRAKANRRWLCVCGATGGAEQFPLVGPTTLRCATCGAQGGHKIKRT